MDVTTVVKVGVSIEWEQMYGDCTDVTGLKTLLGKLISPIYAEESWYIPDPI